MKLRHKLVILNVMALNQLFRLNALWIVEEGHFVLMVQPAVKDLVAHLDAVLHQM